MRDKRWYLAGMIAVFFAAYLAVRAWNGCDLMALLGVWRYPVWFNDLCNTFLAYDRARAGLDPLRFIGVSGEPVYFCYPNIWWALGWLGAGLRHAPAAGVACAIFFYLTTLAYIGRIATRAALGVYAAVLLSPAVLLLVERGNNDIVVYCVLAAACAWGMRRSWLLYAAIVLATVLKYFPAYALVTAFREPSRRRFFAVLGVLVALIGLYGLMTIHEVVRISVLRPSKDYASFGAPILWHTLYTGISAVWGTHAFWAALLFWRVWVVSLVCVFVVLFLRVRTQGRVETPETGALTMFRLGAAIFSGCFAVAVNWDYRLVFLLFTFPQLLAWQGSADHRLARQARAVLILIVLTMWSPLWNRGDIVCIGIGTLVEETLNWVLFIALLRMLFCTLPAWAYA